LVDRAERLAEAPSEGVVAVPRLASDSPKIFVVYVPEVSPCQSMLTLSQSWLWGGWASALAAKLTVRIRKLVEDRLLVPNIVVKVAA
jgi:hypothetical protein